MRNSFYELSGGLLLAGRMRGGDIGAIAQLDGTGQPTPAAADLLANVKDQAQAHP